MQIHIEGDRMAGVSIRSIDCIYGLVKSVAQIQFIQHGAETLRGEKSARHRTPATGYVLFNPGQK